MGRDLDAMELARIEMAATAKWDYVSEDHYLVFQDKVLIIDQSTHKVMYDAEKSSESRWHGDLANGIPSLAQAVEAKHGLPIRADIDSNARVSTIELFEPKSAGGSGRYDHVTGRRERRAGTRTSSRSTAAPRTSRCARSRSTTPRS